MNNDKNLQYLNFLSWINTNGPFGREELMREIIDKFNSLFPPYEIEPGPYDHDNKELDLAIGYSTANFNKLPIVAEFNDKVHKIFEEAYKKKSHIPKISEIMELIENLNIHPRLKMAAALGLVIKYQKVLDRFRDRDAYLKIIDLQDNPEEMLKYIQNLKDEAYIPKPRHGDSSRSVPHKEPGQSRESTSDS